MLAPPAPSVTRQVLHRAPGMAHDGGVRELERRCIGALFSSPVRLCGLLGREGVLVQEAGSGPTEVVRQTGGR